ncbi:MAG TPA: hypothetical protein VM010_08900 [Chitinophagaceae bacterium]|nr:hypothetical protein [Chitinophagaceae bacterium]
MTLFAEIPCAGDLVDLTGQLHTLYHITINGNWIVIKSSAAPQGISGVGLISGEKYQATGVTQSTLSGVVTNGQFSYTAVNNFRIIGRGPGNNFLVHSVFHLTVNAADLSLTSSVDKFSVECR